MEAGEARERRDEEREEKRRKEDQQFLLKLAQVLQKYKGTVRPATVSGRFSVRYQSIFRRHLVKPKRLHINIKQHFLIIMVTEDSTLRSASSKMF